MEGQELARINPSSTFDKMAWQRQYRQRFKRQMGYSDGCSYRTGGLRQEVLERDHYACVRCGMTDRQHKEKWGRPITVDHIDRNRSHNTLANLQTLCLRCHGSKDISASLVIPLVPLFKTEIMSRRAANETYQGIADALGFSVRAIWKWLKRWEQEPGETQC